MYMYYMYMYSSMVRVQKITSFTALTQENQNKMKQHPVLHKTRLRFACAILCTSCFLVFWKHFTSP